MAKADIRTRATLNASKRVANLRNIPSQYALSYLRGFRLFIR
jgi:hypothetical protein